MERLIAERLHVVSAVLVLVVLLGAVVLTLVRPGHHVAAPLFAALFVGQFVPLVIVGDPDNHGGQAGPFDIANLLFLVPPLVSLILERTG